MLRYDAIDILHQGKSDFYEMTIMLKFLEAVMC